MLYLIGSICCSSYLTLSFKALQRRGIPVLPVIVLNYFTCVAAGSIMRGASPAPLQWFKEPWFPWALAMGTSFVILLNLIAFVAQTLGVTVASVSNKLSLVIPVVFSVYLYQETLGWLQWLGIALALTAVGLISWVEEQAAVKRHSPVSKWIYLLPVVLFLGSGFLDTGIKYIEQGFLNDTNRDAFLISAFGTAGLLGTGWYISQRKGRKRPFDQRILLAGVLIGIPNYFSIWFLVSLLKQYGGKSAALIPVNNIGILLVSAFAAIWLFDEKLDRINIAGLILAIVAIAMIAYG